ARSHRPAGPRERRSMERSPRAALGFGGRTRVTRRRLANLADDDERPARQERTETELRCRRDLDDLAADARARLLRASDLRVDTALPRDRVAADAEEGQKIFDDGSDRPDRPRGRDVVAVAARLRERFGAFVADFHTIEPERARDLFEEAGFLAHRFHEGHPCFAKREPQGKTGKSRAAPNIDDPLATVPRTHRDRGERIEKVFYSDVGRRCDRGEVHRRI